MIALGAHGCASSIELISVDKGGQILKKMVRVPINIDHYKGRIDFSTDSFGLELYVW